MKQDLAKTANAPYMAARTAAATIAVATATPIMDREMEGCLHVRPVSIVPVGRDEHHRSAGRTACAATDDLSQHEVDCKGMCALASVACSSCRRSQGVELDCCAVCRRLTYNPAQRTSRRRDGWLAKAVCTTLLTQQAAVQGAVMLTRLVDKLSRLAADIW